jgi:hypothetical protein
MQKINQFREHKLASLEKEIQNEANRLRVDLDRWRGLQIQVTPQVGDAVAAQDACDTEAEKLYLPSDFDNRRRDELQLNHLVDVEMKLREGEAHDALRDLRATVRHINALTFHKQTDDRGRRDNLKSMDTINDFKAKRRLLVGKYNAARSAMIVLGCEDVGEDDDFPPLREEDATMKYSERPYQLGDGKRTDGPLFTAGVGRKVVLPDEPGTTSCYLAVNKLVVTHASRCTTIQRIDKAFCWYCLLYDMYLFCAADL